MKKNALWIKKKHKKQRILVIFLFCFALFFSIPKVVAHAKNSSDGDLSETIEEQIEELNLEELEEYIASLSAFSDQSISKRLLSYIKGEQIDYGSFLEGLFAVFFENVTAMIPAFSCLIAISILCGIVNSLKSNIIGKSVSETVFLIAFISSLIPVLAILTECFILAKESVEEMRTQMEILFPLILTLMAASGGSVSAAIYQPAVAFLCTVIVNIVTSIVFPITLTIIAFSLVGRLSPELKLNKFTAFFKSMNKWIIGVSISVFGMFFTVQGLTSATYDGVAKRAAKYAIGTGVPIVGGFLAGGFDLAIAGGILIKNSLGTLGIFMLLSVLIEPLLTLISVNLLLRLSAAVAEPLGDERISDFLGDTATNLNYCSAGILFVGFLYLVLIVLSICSTEVIL